MSDGKNDPGDTPPLLEDQPPDEAPPKKRFGGAKSLSSIFRPLTQLAPSDFKNLAASLCKVHHFPQQVAAIWERFVAQLISNLRFMLRFPLPKASYAPRLHECICMWQPHTDLSPVLQSHKETSMGYLTLAWPGCERKLGLWSFCGPCQHASLHFTGRRCCGYANHGLCDCHLGWRRCSFPRRYVDMCIYVCFFRARAEEDEKLGVVLTGSCALKRIHCIPQPGTWPWPVQCA
jgi:hypothetical protein